MKPILFYCYDAYCGWCYGFSPVIKALSEKYPGLQIEVLSGGMVTPEKPVHIGATAQYILGAYPRVEELTGVKFGQDYLWHLENPDKSDWYPHSEVPAIALCLLKEKFPEKQVAFAADLQKALYAEGRDLTDPEAYRHLLEKYGLDPDWFYAHLFTDAYRDKAKQEFALVKQLQVNGFPCVLLQYSETKFHLLARGYVGGDELNQRLLAALQSMASAQ
jgi:putative protein-disulfide isomerase